MQQRHRIAGQAEGLAVLDPVPEILHGVMGQPLHDDERDDRPVERDLGPE